MPITGFFDECTTGNAMGSHSDAEKFGTIYVGLPSLPPHLRAKMDFIFIWHIFHYSYREIGGNKGTFSDFIEAVNNLSEVGITFKYNKKKIRIHLFCVAILGDNLGMNQSCGFWRSTAEYYCRVCQMSSKFCKITPTEDPRKLRNRINYDKDVRYQSHGVKEKCIFNNITDFHIAENYTLDIMHDDLGTGPYIFINVLNFLIYVENIITLEKVNSRISKFDYGYLEGGNKPRLLYEEPCKNNVSGVNKTIVCKQSAAEMLCLIRYFGLMIGDLIP